MILTTPNQIEAYRQRVLQKMLRLEILGMKRRGQSAYAIIKAEFSLKGSKQKVYDQLTELLNKEEK